MRHVTAHLNGDTPAHFPSTKLKELLSALAKEHQVDIIFSESLVVSVGLPPRKRARRSLHNNLHSFLRFVERVISQRYEQRPKCEKNEDDQFLGVQLKSYFGTNDVLFQAEEEILCLAFKIALVALRQSDSTASVQQCQSETDVSKNKQENEAHGKIRNTGVIMTALRIIDFVVLTDRCKRGTRNITKQSKTNYQSSCKCIFADKRKRYEHLLQTKAKRNSNGRTQRKKVDSFPETKSIMEEKYPEQMEWVHQFRAKYEPTFETIGLQRSRHLASSPEKIDKCSEMDVPTSNSTSLSINEKEKRANIKFEIVRRRIETMDDVSMSSGESDEETNKANCRPYGENQEPNLSRKKGGPVNNASHPSEVKLASAVGSPSAKTVSPFDKLDKEAHDFRITLLDMPLSESSSTEVVRNTVDQIGNLLSRYGELGGASGISRCGDIFTGKRAIAIEIAQVDEITTNDRYPLNDVMAFALVKEFITDATGSLRAGVFLRSFVLPLMIAMNPLAGISANNQKVATNQGKPASRSLTSLLVMLASIRPIECVESVIVPSLLSNASDESFEPTRFQCELFSRVLRGKDMLSLPACALLVEKILPTKEETVTDGPPTCGGMKWTDNTIPLLTACLNRQPSLHDNVVAQIADEISRHLSANASPYMRKSMKFSTLFHALVTKYGAQVKSTGSAESLKEYVSRLKTFMSKTIGLSLKKL